MKSEGEEFVMESVWSRWRIEITHKLLQGILRRHTVVCDHDRYGCTAEYDNC